jgi:hypothetical protein|tara:strand:- start:3159 stop:3641 length:483 start_codon:yes stop_codon:yes gene_type:complete
MNLATLSNIKNPNEIPKKYICRLCDYSSCNKKDYNKHLLTQKHIKKENSTKNPQKSPNIYICDFCEKIYKNRTGLWRHNKICKKTPEKIESNKLSENNDYKKILDNIQYDVISDLKDIIKQQQEKYQKKLDDIVPKIDNKITNELNINLLLSCDYKDKNI